MKKGMAGKEHNDCKFYVSLRRSQTEHFLPTFQSEWEPKADSKLSHTLEELNLVVKLIVHNMRSRALNY